MSEFSPSSAIWPTIDASAMIRQQIEEVSAAPIEPPKLKRMGRPSTGVDRMAKFPCPVCGKEIVGKSLTVHCRDIHPMWMKALKRSFPNRQILPPAWWLRDDLPAPDATVREGPKPVSVPLVSAPKPVAKRASAEDIFGGVMEIIMPKGVVPIDKLDAVLDFRAAVRAFLDAIS